MNDEMEILNPDIREVTIGVKKLRKIFIYPLSVVDQFKVTDLFQEVIGAFFVNKEAKDMVIVSMFISIIKDNIPKILALVIDPEEDVTALLGEITNNQLTIIGNILYEMNYEIISKNVGGLLKKLPQISKKESPLERPLQSFVAPMDINSKISSESPGETEE